MIVYFMIYDDSLRLFLFFSVLHLVTQTVISSAAFSFEPIDILVDVLETL